MRFPRLLLVPAILLGVTPSFAQGVVGEMFATDASVRGSVLFAGGGMKIESGSSVTAGDASASVKLNRGGEVRVCPRTTVSVTASSTGRDLMFAMNTGSIEAHYMLGSSADTVMTPDFRILLPGPGIFHFAISSDAQGNACVRALPLNTASLIVSELNGDGTYQVKPNVQVLFKNGSVANPSPLVPPDCGCPAPAPPPVLRAEAKPPEPPPPPPQDLPLPKTEHMEMEAPFVYQAGDPQEDLEFLVAKLRLTSGSIFGDQAVLPPPPPSSVQPAMKEATIKPAKSQEKKGFFGKMKSFFAAVFK